MSEEITVVARIDQSNQIYAFDAFNTAHGPYSPPEPEDDPNYVTNKRLPIHLTLATSNSGTARVAAQQMLYGINNVDNAINSQTDHNMSVSILGYTQSFIDFAGNFQGTSWNITDTAPANGGVGSAQYFGQEFNIDSIEYDAITNSNNTGYGSTNYVNHEGVTAVVLHELGHMWQGGSDFFNANVATFNSDPTQDHNAGFYGVNGSGTDYSKNVEKFANDAMIAWAGKLGLDITTSAGVVIPMGLTGAENPSAILARHNGGN